MEEDSDLSKVTVEQLRELIYGPKLEPIDLGLVLAFMGLFLLIGSTVILADAAKEASQ